MKPPKVRDFIAGLRQAGCQPLRVTGSHQIWRTPRGSTFPIVVNHQNDDMSRLVMSKVERVLKSEGISALAI